MANSINTNIAAYYAQANITQASIQASSSVARLSSGNRIVQASDDVAALATGTSLLTSVSALRSALTNASQGTSLLQVADGALAQIQNILQQQKSIALQAGSGSLTDTDRGFLNQQFQALAQQIDSLTSSTTFNGVNLINGALSQTVGVGSNTTVANASTLQVAVTSIANGETLILNGVTFTFTDAAPSAAGGVQRGGSIEQTLDNLVTYLNGVNNNTGATALSATNKALISGAIYSRQGNVLTVTARAGGNLAEFYRVDSLDANNGTSTVASVTGLGRETTTTLSSISVANIDTDVSATGTGDKFANGDLKVDATVIATIANGDTIRTIVNKINALTSSTGFRAYITGTASDYTINVVSSDLAITGDITTGVALTGIVGSTTGTDNTLVSRTGGGESGLGQGSVIGTGSTGGSFSILTDQTQQKATSVISFPDIAAGDLTSSSNFGTTRTITIEGQTFTFTQTAETARAQTEITIGASLQATLDNAVEAINSFAGSASANYAFRQIEARREGNSIIISSRQEGNALDQAGGTLTIAASLMTGGSTSSADLSNTSNTGIDTRGVTNAAFIGVLSGFEADYVSANTVNLSLTVGGIVYSVQNVSTNPTSNTDVRLISETGGYFDIKLRANQGQVVNNSTDAAAFAARIDAAFSGVTFSQRRDVSSYKPSGDLLGSTVRFQNSNFSNLKIDSISVSAPSGSNVNGVITFTVNGEAYTSLTPLGSQLGAYSITRFVSASDANKFIEFRAGALDLSFATSDAASELQTALRTAFGVGTGAAALSFQIGVTTADTVKVSIGSAKTVDLYGGQALSVATQAGAAAASSVLDSAINIVTSLRAGVGALESQFNFASAALQSSVQNQDAARGQLLDTDIATESTAYATSQVKLQAGISVLAQANQSLQALLKLIG